MVRIKRGVSVKKRHNKIKASTKGFTGRGSTSYRVGIQRLQKAMVYQYVDRRKFKRNISRLWIVRINNSCRMYGLSLIHI